MNSADWNNVLSNVVKASSGESSAKTEALSLLIRNQGFDKVGTVLVKKKDTVIRWKEEIEEDEEVPQSLKQVVSKDKDQTSGCATPTSKSSKQKSSNKTKKPKVEVIEEHDFAELDSDIDDIDEDDENEDENELTVEGMDDSEWWTMVSNTLSCKHGEKYHVKITAQKP